MKYPKIQTLWKRDPDNNFIIIPGEFSCPEFENIKKWHFTEKIDGTNIRVIYDLSRVQFRGRTDKAQIPQQLFNVLEIMFTLDKMDNVFNDAQTHVILFGEGYGAGIQKGGGLYRLDKSFVLFDVWIDGWWLQQDKVREIADLLKIHHVPDYSVLDARGSIEDAIDIVKHINRSVLAEQNRTMEGIVARSAPLMLFRNGNPIMFKLKVKDYEDLGK